MTLPQTLRQADLQSLSAVLNEQHARAFDVVMPASQIKVIGTQIELTGIREPVLTEQGVTDVNGLYTPTNVAEEGISQKLDIPLAYLRRCRTQAPALYQENITGWLTLTSDKFLLRCLRADDSVTGVLRAFLSDQYKVIDNIDVLMAVLAGMQEAGIEDPEIDADLTERRMIVRVVVPQIAVLADKLLENYRSPFDGSDVGRGWTPERVQRISAREGQVMDPRTVFGGFVFSNSEVGSGMFRLFPQLTVQVCGNGLSLTAEGIARKHLGAELEEGIQWSQATQEANLELIKQQTADQVRSYLDVDFVTKQVEKLERVAGAPIENATETITAVSRKLNFTEAQQSLILSHFIRGGQTTAGGVLQAVTSAAQVVRDGDVAYEMEQVAVKAMQLAAGVAR